MCIRDRLGLQAYAEFDYRQIFDKERIAPRLFACTGADAEALSRISAFNKTPLLSADSDLPNGAKFLLYQDPLCGIYDADAEGMGSVSYTHLLLIASVTESPVPESAPCMFLILSVAEFTASFISSMLSSIFSSFS